jgi:hypothetical protein
MQHSIITTNGRRKIAHESGTLFVSPVRSRAPFSCHWFHRYYYHPPDHYPNDCRCFFLYAVETHWDLFLAALLVEGVSRQDLDQSWTLQPGFGRQ